METKSRPTDAPSRRDFLKAAGALLLSSACTRLMNWGSPEIPRIGSASLSAVELGLIPGRTSFDDAKAEMARRGIAGIVESTNTFGERSFRALTGTRQDSIHIFRGGAYEQSIQVNISAGTMPVYTLRVANHGEQVMIVALTRDANAYLESPPPPSARLAIVPYGENGPASPIYFDLRELERENRGMQQPLLVGYDLKDGITFIAADNRGLAWAEGYILSFDGTELHRRPVGIEELAGCSCVMDWLNSL